MQTNTRQLADDLQRVAHELEGMLKTKASSIAERAGVAAERVQAGLDEASERVTTLEKVLQEDLSQKADATGRFVHGNPWLAAGIAAAFGFLIGVVVARHD